MESELFELVVNEIAATMDIPAASLHMDATLAEIGMDSLEAMRGYLANASMSFRQAVTPGDQMLIEASVLRRAGNLLIAKVKLWVAGAVVDTPGVSKVQFYPRGRATIPATSLPRRQVDHDHAEPACQRTNLDGFRYQG